MLAGAIAGCFSDFIAVGLAVLQAILTGVAVVLIHILSPVPVNLHAFMCILIVFACAHTWFLAYILKLQYAGSR